MESKSEQVKRSSLNSRCIGLVASGYAMARIKRLQSFTADTRTAALVHVDAIISRGHYAAMKNIAGQFVVSELVVA